LPPARSGSSSLPASANTAWNVSEKLQFTFKNRGVLIFLGVSCLGPYD
jgi:hypothetical protein